MLISAHKVTKSFGSKELFGDLGFSLSEREKVGLIGPNGTGKSTFLKILAGLEKPDSGEVSIRKSVRFQYVGQADDFLGYETVEDALRAAGESTFKDRNELIVEIARIGSLLGFESLEEKISGLSGGWRKRLSIGCSLINDPEVLLLDEPTNHMDWEGLYWLEDLLKNAKFSFLLVSHDRKFLDNVCNRIFEINPAFKNGHISFPGSYSKFLERKLEHLEAQQKQEASLANKLRREVEWLRRGPQARTTKSRSRIDAAGLLAEEVGEVSSRNSLAKRGLNADFGVGQVQSKDLLQLKNISKSYGENVVLNNFNFSLRKGSRVGVLGLNGSGKSTLLKIISGVLAVDSGEVLEAEGLTKVYFDQGRAELDLKATLMENLTGGDSDHVIYRNQSIHGAAYARKFHFIPDQFNIRAENLSGGERARLLLARLMLQEGDVLILDEPTNDLDIETLGVLERSLEEFPGAIVIVSHDRLFLDKVADGFLGVNRSGEWKTYSEFSLWESECLAPKKESRAKGEKTQKPTKKRKKLSYMEQREFDGIEEAIAEAEARLEELQQGLQDPKVMADSEALNQAIADVAQVQTQVDHLYQRWEYLEQKQEGEE